MDIKLVVIQVQSKHMLPPNCSFVGKQASQAALLRETIKADLLACRQYVP
jgi:hypothetical protein